MLKNNGKKNKFIKCDKCNNQVEINKEEIVKIAGIEYCECIYCGQEIILK